jgi:hypothetical protein
MSFVHSPKIVTDGLVLALDAGNTKSYTSGSTTWYDKSGNARNGTLINGPTFATGSIVFDGTNDYVDCGNIGTIGNHQTVEVWFRSTSVIDYKNILDMNYSTYPTVTGNVGPRLEQYTNGDLRWCWSGITSSNDPFNRTVAGVTVSANNWYQAAFTLASGSYTVYVNGIQRDSGSSASGFVTTYGSVNIGRGFSLVNDRYFTGNESIFHIYNRALSAAEVLQNFNALRGRYGI